MTVNILDQTVPILPNKPDEKKLRQEDRKVKCNYTVSYYNTNHMQCSFYAAKGGRCMTHQPEKLRAGLEQKIRRFKKFLREAEEELVKFDETNQISNI